MRKRLGAVICTSAVAATVMIAGPAFANDYSAEFNPTSGPNLGRGTWDDLTDNLCAKSYVGPPSQTKIVVKIAPTPGESGGPFQVTDTGNSSGTQTCTGNLSIPEDQLYRMTIVSYQDDGIFTQVKGTFRT